MDVEVPAGLWGVAVSSGRDTLRDAIVVLDLGAMAMRSLGR
jgi:hypothetical protein